jgi:hypothetical protein
VPPELDLSGIVTIILMPIHSTHSHRASEDTEEDPTRAVATRSCHCVRNMALLAGNTLTPFVRFALFAACFAMGKKLLTDKTLRLHKSGKNH